jgi:nitrogen fixation protein FixH
MLPLMATDFASSGWHLVLIAMMFFIVIVILLTRFWPLK